MSNEEGTGVDALGDRLARLREASLRITESLDLNGTLQGVVDGARSLAGARACAATVLDERGEVQAVVTSGLSENQHRVLEETPSKPELSAYLCEQTEPLRLSDLSAELAKLGIPDLEPPLGPVRSFLLAPIRLGSEQLGAVYLADKADGSEFTPEDEAAMAMFASQAALAIANERRYRDEQKARTDLESLIDISPVGVVVFDTKTGMPVSYNREALRIVSTLYDGDACIEDMMESLTVRREDGLEIAIPDPSLTQALAMGETLHAEELVFSVPDGRSVKTLVNATPIRTEDGEVETLILTMQDMSSLEELERLRAEFLAMVSHELRTPLATLKGSVTALLNPPSALKPEESHQFFTIIDAQIDRMHVLVSDLLDVARIETGTFAISPEPTDVAVLVAEARNAFLSGGGGHGIEIEIPAELPWVMADRLRIVQVLNNLLNNGARHSPGTSPLRVTAAAEGIHVAISVSDQGRGIPAESLPHLFRKFSRIESEEQGGDTGLGLAICQGIVEAHGGRIWAESEGPGLGARFTFTIPTAEEGGFVSPAAAGRLGAPATRRGARQEALRVLAVDDEPEALRYLRDALVKSGYEPLLTGDPQEALQILEEQRPGLVLLDLMLPGTDGIELMREMGRTADVPVIFVSAYGQDHLVAKAFDMGAADYVVKPFSPTELAARIRAVLRRREAQQPTAPYVLSDLTIDYEERRVTLAGQQVRLTDIEYRTLAELSANAGRVSTYEQLQRRVWGSEGEADVGPIRTVIHTLRTRLGDNAGDPTYIFTQPRVGYRMPRSEGSGGEAAGTP
ncbi:MAG: response regulator [Chloroflexota bacterium]|nr:response regulator [Chloroflexota bacterium]